MRNILLCMVLLGTACMNNSVLTASDGKPFQCRRACPINSTLPEIDYAPTDRHANVKILDDCCIGPDGTTFSSCAWNSGQWKAKPQ